MKTKISILTVTMLMVLSAILVMPIGIENAKAETWIQTTDSDFASGTLENVEIVGTGDGALIQLEKKNELGIWHQQQLIPSARSASAMAYDSKNNKVVLFGGNDGAVDDETWVYDVASDTWTQKSPITKPSARDRHAMAYDSGNNKVVLFGGNDGARDDETWVYDLVLDTWTQKSPSTSPLARENHAMAYDSTNNKVVLFGGNDGGLDAETWVYDLSLDTWTDKSPATNPSARENHAMAYDSANNKIVLFGGYDAGTYDDETWIYDLGLNTWTQKSPSTIPSARRYHAMAYDSANNKIVLFGGNDGSLDAETWVYDLVLDTWTQKSPSTSPGVRENHAMAYDSANNKVVLFGGDDGAADDETWVYDLDSDTWTQKSTSTRPTVRRCFSMAYDSTNKKVVIFGGMMGFWLDETWVYDVAADNWIQMSPSSKPSTRNGHAMVYDSANNKIVLFGGYGSLGTNDETWVYDVASNIWTEKTPSTSPSARQRHAMAYDSLNNKVVLFGGLSGGDQTWVYDTAANTWTQMSPSTKPTSRGWHTMTYDSENNKVVLFGGNDGSYDDETWLYDTASNTWTQMNPTIKPSAREASRMEYDSVNNKVILFGGYDGSRHDDTWVYDVESDNWTQKNPIIKPLPRQRHKMTFDSDNEKLVLFGGWDDGSAYDNETWIYNYNNYYNTGTYTSKTFTSNNYKWHRITWGTDTDPDGFVRFQVAINDDGSTWDYVGPDGTSLTFYDEVTGGNLYSGYNGKYLRYRAYFTTPYAGCTPKLHEVSITYITEKPTVTVTSPNGGEDWMKGAYYPITWDSEGDFNATPVCLYYSTDNGASWTTILNWTENTGYYNWTVPSITTASGLIKVSVLDIYGIEESDCSDASFAIDPPPPISGGITSPTGITIWGEGEHAIQWNLGGYMGLITLEYTMDGQNWTEIGGNLPNTNSYSWDIPSGINSQNARIRLKAQDEFLNVHTFLSKVFTIDTEPPVISHQPVVDATVDVTITFEASASDNFEVTSVTLYNNQGSGFMPISLSEIGGVYRAEITPTMEGTMGYYITVSDGANSVSTDVYQVDVRSPEKPESKEEGGFPWFIGASLVCGVIAGIVIGLALNRYLPKKEK